MTYSIPSVVGLQSDDTATKVFRHLDRGHDALLVSAYGSDAYLFLGSFADWTNTTRTLRGRGKHHIDDFDDGQAFARPLSGIEREMIREQAGAAVDEDEDEDVAAELGLERNARGEWVEIPMTPSHIDRSGER